MSDCSKRNMNVRFLVFMVLLLFFFLVPEASAFKIDYSYPKTVNESDGEISIVISLRAENSDVGSCRVSGELTKGAHHNNHPVEARVGEDYEIVNQGSFDLFINGNLREERPNTTEAPGLNSSSTAVKLRITQDEIQEPLERIHLHTKILQNIG